MTKATTQKTLKNKTSETSKALVIIDFGNGDVKLKVRLPGSNRFSDYFFPSYVAETASGGTGALTVITDEGLKTYVVGEQARDMPNARTGATAGKKAEFSNVLFLHALRLAFGVPTEEIHTDVIFTSPSVASYGDEMISRLRKRHHVQIPKAAFVPGSKAQNYVVEVHKVAAHLEGHLGYAACEKLPKAPLWVIDVGNRTTIATLVSPDGGIMQRRPFDESGVWNIADRIVAGELLGTRLKTPSTQQVIDYLLDGDRSDDIARAIAPALQAAVSEALAFIPADGHKRYIIGGGAKLPGIESVLNASAVKSATTANVDAIATFADVILEDA